MDVRRFAWPSLAFVIAAAATVVGSTSPGLWDPLELDFLDAARAGLAPIPPLGPSASLAFGDWLSGVHAAGRLPIALFGLLTAAATFALARLATDARGASYAVLLLAGAPVLVLNSRLVIGESPVLLAQTLVALGAFGALVAVADDRRWFGAALVALGAGTLAAAFGSGILLGVVPGLFAAVVTAWIAPERVGRRVRIGLTLAALACGGLVAFDVIRDAATYRASLGGAPRGDEPPAFHHALEMAFHGLGPLAALVPIGAAWFFLERRASKADLLARFAILWAAFAYGAAVLFEARYGTTTFAAAPALAVLVALVLRARDERPEGSRLAALVVALFAGLLVRDALLFPASSFDSLRAGGVSIPEDVDLRVFPAASGLLFLAVAIPILSARVDGARKPLSAPYRAIRGFWERDWTSRGLLVAGATALVVLAVIGVVGAVSPDALPIRSVISRALGALVLAILSIPAIVALAQLALRLAARLGTARHGALALAAAASGLVFAFGTLPTLSRAFSPREVFDALSEHRSEGEPLVVFEAAERSVDHYAHPPVERVKAAALLSRALERDERVWALLPKSKLAEVDRLYRARRGEHVFVMDDRNPLAYLLTNRPPAGATDRNPLRDFVSKRAPATSHAVGAKLRGGYELVGYEIVGDPPAIRPGERFTLRLVWRMAQKSTRALEVFVHLDGPGGRVHGDHVPVDGLYPTTHWEAGDVVIDEVQMRVPAHYAPGRYTFYVGLYQGSYRAEVLEGNEDADNRIVAGTVQVR